ncbi:hypothetical protein BLNAU_13684 [Blattamonas nauphoetae]|uniref:Leucine-rich repeat domain-containing protein n=1 Tax=Blattamonas nauphoetae TaxID=2049346 RepID=A0ABQ9XIW3_9EUKA|nr:hypothetical protein BLNAU_13684 [Blattamonas nauphoetae]
MLNKTKTVEISSSSFKDISYLPVLSNEETEAEKPTKQINEIVSVNISSSSFKNCEAALEFSIVPALTAQSLKISSSSFKECGLVQAVPEYVAEETQHIQISASSFKNQYVDLEGRAGFLTFDSEQGMLGISSR